jgi:N-acetylglucosaminyldiphosphoundecaprenol N-acetyl-beta-D-mannosaminyltransferase
MSRVVFMETPIDLLSMDETVALAEQAMASRRPMRHVAINVAKLMKLGKDPELARDVNDSDIVGLDGMGVVWALRLFGVRKARRVAGCDLMMALLDHCARKGRKPYVLGAKQDVLDRALAVAAQRYTNLQFAGSRNGYFGPADEDEIVEAIRASGADCLFVAMPTPRKERFLARNADRLGVPFIMGVGGSVDVLAGHVSRAPQWMQDMGLEWLHRLLQEPRKMAWRYISTNSAFALTMLGLVLRGKKPVRYPGA